MNLCFVVNNFNVGGLEKVVISLINNLDRSQFNIFLICLNGKGALFDQTNVDPHNTLVIEKSPGFDLSVIFKIRQFLKSKKINVLHAHNFGPLIYAGLAARSILMNRPAVIYSEHNQVYRQIKKGVARTRRTLALADLRLTVSRKLQKFYRDELGIKRDVATVYNGIPKADPDGNAVSRVSIGVREDSFLFGTAVVLSEQKGIVYLLEAAKKIKQQERNIQIVIAGDGDLRNELETYVKDNELDEQVIFLGYRSDVHDLIRAYDVYILPSLWEGLPLALLEAMSMGKAIVATDVGGNAEIVEHGVNGVIVPSGDSDALFEAMIDVADGAQGLEQCRDRNIAKFDTQFSLDSMIENHSKIYNTYSNG